MRNIFVAGFVILLVLLGIVLLAKGPSASQYTQEQLASFAQCLKNTGITMYGAQWCPHCQNEKKAFGDAFKYIPYVECPDNPQTCLSKGVEGYPTWVLGSGKKLVGEQGLRRLSLETGCQLPQETENSK